MRTGTFSCLMFGHKFKRSLIVSGDMWEGIATTYQTPFCMRCGINNTDKV